MKKHYSFLLKNKLWFFLSAVLTISVSFDSSAQTVPAVQWDRTFGCGDRDDLRYLEQTRDGGFILGGWSRSDSCADKSQTTYGPSFWILKLNAQGEKDWDKSFDSEHDNFLVSVQQTADGGYILGGHSGTWAKCRIIKLNESGEQAWEKTITPGNTGGHLTNMQQTKDGGYILGGYSWTDTDTLSAEGRKNLRAGNGDWDYFIIKLDSRGNKLWEKTFGGKDSDRLYALEVTKDGGYILGGVSTSTISGDKTAISKKKNAYGKDYWIIKLNAAGEIKWDIALSGSTDSPFLPNEQALVTLKQTSDGGYIVGGGAFISYSGEAVKAGKTFDNFYVAKLNKKGKLRWEQVLGSNGGDKLNSVQQTADKGFILGGISRSEASGDKTEASRGNWDYWIVKLNSKGEKQWDKTLGGSEEDFLYMVKQTKDNGYILGGTSKSSTSGNKSQDAKGATDYWIIKLGSKLEK